MESCEKSDFLGLVEIVASACRSMPTKVELLERLVEVDAAQERGYFLPDEDERIREVYCHYLRTRTILSEAITGIEPFAMGAGEVEERKRLEYFAVGFTAACVLVRSASFIVDLAGDRFLVWKKLDEAESRYGLPRRTFTEVYKNLASPKRVWLFQDAIQFFEENVDAVMGLSGGGFDEIVQILSEEREFIERRRVIYLKRRVKYRIFSFLRRNHSGYRKVMFHLFRFSGSAIAEMKQPLIAAMKAGKRVTPRVLAKAGSVLKPGDVLVTRHDDAMSNLFLPGFWPHAAFYIGDRAQREALGLEVVGAEDFCLVEAKKDGVKFRNLAETLAVDAFVVLRPTVSEAVIKDAIGKAVSHVGKRYDFLFDFSCADRLACTEVVYRSYHGVGGVNFRLNTKAGRQCMSAESLLDQSVGRGWFEPVMIYGVAGIKVVEGERAREVLRGSYASGWGVDPV